MEKRDIGFGSAEFRMVYVEFKSAEFRMANVESLAFDFQFVKSLTESVAPLLW